MQIFNSAESAESAKQIFNKPEDELGREIEKDKMAEKITYTWREVVEAIIPHQREKFLNREERWGFYLVEVSQGKIIIELFNGQRIDLYQRIRDIWKTINEEGKFSRKRPKSDVIRHVDYALELLRNIYTLFAAIESPDGRIVELHYSPLIAILPKSPQLEKTTLFIIGNGFDRFNNLNTRYWDFHEWLKTQPNGEEFIETMEQVFSTTNREGENLLWTDFEKATGKCDIERIFEGLEEQFEEDRGEYNRYLMNIQDEIMVGFVNPIQKEMPLYFIRWIEDINNKIYKLPKITNISDKLQGFTKEGLFLTFNYTDTLEYLYQIPETNICHIHNRVKANEQPIIGHNNKAIEIERPLDITQGEINEKQNMAKVIDNLKKNHHDNIKKHTIFFDRLGKHINKVVVYGHSMNDIDMPYFRSVKRRIAPDARWYVSYHNDDDYKSIEMARRGLKIEPSCFTPFLL